MLQQLQQLQPSDAVVCAFVLGNSLFMLIGVLVVNIVYSLGIEDLIDKWSLGLSAAPLIIIDTSESENRVHRYLNISAELCPFPTTTNRG